jgi:hypothetical protein
MTDEERLCYSEGKFWRDRVKAISLPYCSEVTNENPYTLVPDEPELSAQYHQRRMQVTQDCLRAPDQFAAQHASFVALSPGIDPIAGDDLAIKGAIINLWIMLAGGVPVPPPAPVEAVASDAAPPAAATPRPPVPTLVTGPQP